jgi:hypothetical protein
MSDKIVEGNKMIAEFMGFNVLPVDSLSGKRYEVIDFEHGRIKVENLDVDCFYHTSWDWLMPVVEKISKHHLHNWDGTECTDVIDTSYPVTFNMPDEEGNVMFRFKGFSLHTGKSLIDITWQAVVEFIKWYINNQTESHE